MPRRFFHAKKEVMEVPNEENLIPVRSESEARERGAKGGKASGEARRKKKKLRETMEALLQAALKDEELTEKLKKFGFRSGMNMQEAIAAAMISQAAKGNVRAFEAIKDTIDPKGEAPEGGGVRVIVEGRIEDLSAGAPDD